MRIGVITFPGSNCDDDCRFVLRKLGCDVHALWHKTTPDLAPYSLVILPGGFSYGDYLRTGAMAALSPVMESVHTYAKQGGFVLGICNGFQILCEAGLLPGALARNETCQFICKDVSLEVMDSNSPWTRGGKKEWVFPVAHGHGRVVLPPGEYQKLYLQNQLLLKYKENPNGSEANIAALSNEQKNVMGLMPHPERATFLGSQDGLLFWNSILSYLQERQ